MIDILAAVIPFVRMALCAGLALVSAISIYSHISQRNWGLALVGMAPLVFSIWAILLDARVQLAAGL